MSKTTKEEALQLAKSAFGFVPNLMAGIAEQNPAVVATYLGAQAGLAGGALTGLEHQIVMLAVSAFNECHYCSAAHRTAAKAMGASQADIEAIDDRRLPDNDRFRNLASTTWLLMSERGWVSEEKLVGSGLTRPEIYEVIAIIGLKTISNYINHIQKTEVDAAFKAQQKREVKAA